MKKFFYGLAILLCTACQQSNVPADKIAIDGIYENGNTAELELCLRPLGGMTYTDAIMMKDSANTFTGEFPVSETGFYGMYGILNGGQLTVPVYLPKGGKIYELTLRNENGVPMLELDKDNEALSAYNKFIYRHGQDFWMNGKNIPSEALQAYVARYMVVADSIANEYRCSKPVKEYMQLWAATSMESMYNSLPRTLGVKKADLPFTKEELLAGATECYKSPIASCFPSVTQSIALTLPDGSLSEKLAYVYENYTYPGTQMRVVEIVMSGYIGRFNYAENFEQGLAELNEVVSRFKLDEKYVADFTKRRASAKGAPFPKDVTLTDADGKPMDISMFKGNYVYVDLWASWCVPCCREVPHLQKLEKELKNPLVKFLSISIDTKKESWLKKMKDLNMHGNQWLNQDNSLGNAYNVSGIPYFFILDKEGRLYMSNAPRPSHPELRQLLEGLK